MKGFLMANGDNMQALRELASEVGTYAANMALLKQELGEERVKNSELTGKLQEAEGELSRMRTLESAKAKAK